MTYNHYEKPKQNNHKLKCGKTGLIHEKPKQETKKNNEAKQTIVFMKNKNGMTN